ncbi:uncharacterized protein LOC119296125 isoform X2 [Triticum dicoccoides]|uniref:uncharacterized protein LOC119296125 isoform X2 n=1 Tax=Triticum dicoccoides TaxID=85692 RepID=UPI00188E1278|nr:uncharacterized protein LOC119296125 isoform X2 [Triticum dicoccoides]
MNTDAQLRFNCRKRCLPADGRLDDHWRGQQRKRRGVRVLVPDCFLVPPPEAKSADFDMWDYIRSIPDMWDNGLRLLKDWVRASKDVPQDPPDLTYLTKNNDVKPGRVVGSWKIENSRKVALKAVKPRWKDLLEETRHNDKRLREIGDEVAFLEKTLEEQRKLAEPPKEDLSQFFVPLTAEDEKEVQDCLYGNGSSSKVLVLHEPSNIEVSREKFRCLRPHGWLNDEVINLYLELLKERGIREPKRFLKCHFFNTFFYKKRSPAWRVSAAAHRWGRAQAQPCAEEAGAAVKAAAEVVASRRPEAADHGCGCGSKGRPWTWRRRRRSNASGAGRRGTASS